MGAMIENSSQSATLLEYLLEHDSLLHDQGALCEHVARHGVIRLVCARE
jgi:hypothetical protein